MENILQEAGDCGLFQVYYVTAVQSCRMAITFAISLMIFGLYNPGWRCNASHFSINETSTLDNNTTSAPDIHLSTYRTSATGVSHFPTMADVEDQTEIPGNGSQGNGTDVYIDSCDVISFCASIDFNPESSTIVSEFGLLCDDLWKAYLLISILNAGLLIGGFVCGQVGERFGRKVGLYGSNAIVGIACALAVFSPTWQVYAVCTFFIGFGSMGTVMSLSVLTMEFLNSKWRARVSSIPVWEAGVMCFALVVYFLRDWRLIHLTTAGISAFTCLGFFWTPESFRWLVLHGKTSKAKKVIQNIAKVNNRSISEGVMKELIKHDGEEDENRHYTYTSLFKTRDLRYLMIKLGLIWVVVNFVYEVLGFGIQALPGDFYTNIVLASAIEFPGVLLNGPVANRIGRRNTGIVFLALGSLCCATIVISLLAMEESSSRDILISSLAFINKSITQALINLMFTYSAELMPTAVRSLGFGFFSVLTRFVGIFSPYMIPRDFPSMVASFCVLMASQASAIAVFCTLSETKDKPLSDTIDAEEERHEL